MSRIITDLEHGAVVLIHDLTTPPTPGETLPAEVLGTVGQLAARLGIDAAGLTPQQAGWVSDLIGHVVDTLSAPAADAGHAQAPNEPAPTEPPPAGGNTEVAALDATTAPQTPSADTGAQSPQAPVDASQAAAQQPTEASAPPADTSNLDAVIAKASQQYGAGGGAA